MRRIGLIFMVTAAAAAAVLVSSAAAGSERTYQVEFGNAFGLVNGSEVRIAGVKAGTVTALDINEEKQALITIKISDEFGEFHADATCSSEPQSLIAEYFVDCQPGKTEAPLPDGIVPIDQTTLTVPNDLVQNTLREPFKRRLQLLINEFGTALTGNSEDLNAAILRGAPALRELKETLDILAAQNTTIRDLNANSDAIISQLNNRREDVVRFINEANDTAAASAERRTDLSETFRLLPGFLAELQPTMRQLGRVADQGRPLLVDLNKAAPGLTRFADRVPAFNDATAVSLKGLGNAAQVGTRALTKGDDEINQLRQSTVNAPRAADLLAGFFESLDNPKNAVEEDHRARVDLNNQPGEADRRTALLNQKVGGGLTDPGYTGLEGLLNYGYYQAGSLNQYDASGHILHLNVVQSPESPCSGYNATNTYPNGSTNPQSADSCASLLGGSQPGIGGSPTGPTTYNGHTLPPYDPSVCPRTGPGPASDFSTDLALCDPDGPSIHGGVRKASQAQKAAAVTPEQLDDIEKDKPLPQKLQDALGITDGSPLSQNPQLQQLLEQLGAAQAGGSPSTQSGDVNKSLLDFLFSS